MRPGAADDIACLKPNFKQPTLSSAISDQRSTKKESQFDKPVNPASPPPCEERRIPDGTVVWTPNSPHRLSPEDWTRVLQEDANQQQYRKDWEVADKLPEFPPGAVSL